MRKFHAYTHQDVAQKKDNKQMEYNNDRESFGIKFKRKQLIGFNLNEENIFFNLVLQQLIIFGIACYM